MHALRQRRKRIRVGKQTFFHSYVRIIEHLINDFLSLCRVPLDMMDELCQLPWQGLEDGEPSHFAAYPGIHKGLPPFLRKALVFLLHDVSNDNKDQHASEPLTLGE